MEICDGQQELLDEVERWISTQIAILQAKKFPGLSEIQRIALDHTQ